MEGLLALISKSHKRGLALIRNPIYNGTAYCFPRRLLLLKNVFLAYLLKRIKLFLFSELGSAKMLKAFFAWLPSNPSLATFLLMLPDQKLPVFRQFFR